MPLRPQNPSPVSAPVRVPPSSVDSEQSILGGLLLNSRAFDEISDLLTEDDFYRADHRVIFDAISTLASRGDPADVITVYNELEKTGKGEQVGGRAYLNELANNSLGAGNIRSYAKIVRDCSLLRQLIEAGDGIVTSALAPDGRTAGEVIDEAEASILQINEKSDRLGQGFVKLNKLAANVSSRVSELYRSKSNSDVTGIPTGFVDLDRKTAGLQKGDLIIVAGRPSMGKTTLAINIAENVAIGAREQFPVAVFSMEMGGEQLAQRIICSRGRLDAQKVRKGRLDGPGDWDRFTTAVAELENAQFFIDDTPNLTVTAVRSRVRRLRAKVGPLALVVIDYLQLMSGSGRGRDENRATELSEISRGLKGLAKEMDVPVVALSQLNRSVDSRTDRRPQMSDLRESGAIEQDADVIMFIYRECVYNKDADPGMAEVIIGKQRNGPIGVVPLTFLGQFTRFENREDSPGGYASDDAE